MNGSKTEGKSQVATHADNGSHFFWLHWVLVAAHGLCSCVAPGLSCLPTCGNYGFPGGTVIKNLSANAGDAGSVSDLGGSPGGGSGNPLQYSCLGNPMDRGAWWAIVRRVAQSQT